MTMGYRVVLAAVAVVGVELMACRPAVPPVPGKGGPPWIELTSAHFTVWTDADPGRAREIVAKMERLRVILVYAVFPNAPAQGRDLAIVLRDDPELRAFSSTDEKRAFAVAMGSPLWQPMIVLSADADRRELEVTLAHELVHLISFGVVHHQPRWYSEGMATYFQTAGLDPKLTTVEIGGPPVGAPIATDHLVPMSELFEWRGPARETKEARKYATAWELFWFLFNRHPAELQRYAHLIDGAGAQIAERPELARRIWDLSFPTLPFNAVDDTLEDWMSAAEYDRRSLTVQPGLPSTTKRELGDADVYAIRALLRHLAGRGDAEARHDVSAALAAESTHVLARLLAAELDHTEITADQVRAIASAHADDWRAWLLVAHAAPSAQAEAARARACEIAAANPALSPPAELCSGRRASLPEVPRR